MKNCSKYLYNKSPCSISIWFISMVTFIRIRSPPRTLPTPPWRRRTLCPSLVSLSFFFFFQLLQGWQCLFEVLRCTGIISELLLFERSHQYFCNRNILVRSNGGYDLRPQKHPIVDHHLRLDHFQSFDCGIVHLVWIYHGYPGRTSCTSSSAGWRCNIPCLPVSYRIGVREIALSLWRSQEWKRVHRVLDEFLILFFLYARNARTCSRQCQCPNLINILWTAFMVPSRAIHTIQCFHLHESFVLILDWKD